MYFISVKLIDKNIFDYRIWYYIFKNKKLSMECYYLYIEKILEIKFISRFIKITLIKEIELMPK